MKLEFIKNILDVEVDSLRHVNHYVVKAMYNKIHDEGWAEIDHKLIEKIDITWDEIDKNGGVGDFVNRLRKKYDIPERW